MYIFGGWDGVNTLSDIYKYNFKESSWTKVNIAGDAPPHRYRHSAVLFKSCMYIFGGVDQEHRRFNDLQCFDLQKRVWNQLELCGNIPTRSFHSATVIDNQMFVIGGYDGVNRLNDVHQCSLPIPNEHQQLKKIECKA
jgi:hypothetical protein